MRMLRGMRSRCLSLLLSVLVIAGCDGSGAGPSVGPSTPANSLSASNNPSTPAAVNPTLGATFAKRACTPPAVPPQTLAAVANMYRQQSTAATEASRLDNRWTALAMATSALSNTWDVLQSYPTRRGHPLALNVAAMDAFQKGEYKRRKAVAQTVYTTILIECKKATG